MMKPILFVATCNAEESRKFYQEVLQLPLVDDQPFALVFDTGGHQLRVQKVEQVQAPPYTTAGWEVDDIEAVVNRLVGKGVTMERYAFLQQEESGVWITPDAAKVAWFKDPDGNLLSLTQAPEG